MVDKIFFPNPVQVTTPQSIPRQRPAVGGDIKTPFAKVLDEKSHPQGVSFSQHAQERLRARGIDLSETDLRKLEGAVESLARKGGKESLVMLGDAAFVVSVKNRTVVTALDRDAMQGNVFTNIDSAVLLK
jgi:flagellar operon protein